MKIVDVEPNTAEWLEWRETGPSASEAPAVMNESKFFPRTQYELYLKKTGKKNVIYTPAMRDGHRFEEQIVKHASDKLGINFKPICVQYCGFLASLDGFAYNDDGEKLVLEVKTTSLDSDIWNHGEEIYKWQLVHQAYVCGVTKVHFVVYAKDANAYKFNTVGISEDDKTKLVNAWQKFNDCLLNFKIPELCERDTIENNSELWKSLAEQYQALTEEKAKTEARLKTLKDELVKIANGRPMKGAGINVYPVQRKGSIDYTRVELLKGVDLEEYRKKPSSYWVVK